jgi:hypothetical protein
VPADIWFDAALDAAVRDGSAWGLVTKPDAEAAGPMSAFRLITPDVVVGLANPIAMPDGVPTGEIEVSESGAGRFTVVTERFADGWAGLRHPIGGNRIAWSPDGSRVLLTASESPAVSWTHVRFLLRHLYTSAAASRAGHGVAHAVVAESAIGGVLIGGPTLSGKTRLINRLIERGVAGDVIEDDCPVLMPDGSACALFPTMHELRSARRIGVSVAVGMVDGMESPMSWPPAEMASWLGRCQVPWPAAWLPFGFRRDGSAVPVSRDTVCVAVPARSDDRDDVVDYLAATIGQIG